MNKLLLSLMLLPSLLWAAQPPYERNRFTTNTDPNVVSVAANTLAGTNKWAGTNIFSAQAITDLDARFGGGGAMDYGVTNTLLNSSNTWTGPNIFGGSTNRAYGYWEFYGNVNFLGGYAWNFDTAYATNLWVDNLTGPAWNDIYTAAAGMTTALLTNGVDSSGASNLNASALASGTVPDARLSTNALLWTNSATDSLALTHGGSNTVSIRAFTQNDSGITIMNGGTPPTNTAGCYDNIVMGRRVATLSAWTNVFRTVLIGEGPAYQSLWNNVNTVTLIGTEPGFLSSWTNSVNVFGIGYDALSNSQMTNSFDVYALASDALGTITLEDSLDIIGLGRGSIEEGYITNSSDIIAIGYNALGNLTGLDSGTPGQGAGITNSHGLIVIGRDAGTNIAGVYTNVVLLGTGATVGSTGQDQLILSPNMGIQVGTNGITSYGTSNHFTGDLGVAGTLGVGTATATTLTATTMAGNGSGLTNGSGYYLADTNWVIQQVGALGTHIYSSGSVSNNINATRTNVWQGWVGLDTVANSNFIARADCVLNNYVRHLVSTNVFSRVGDGPITVGAWLAEDMTGTISIHPEVYYANGDSPVELGSSAAQVINGATPTYHIWSLTVTGTNLPSGATNLIVAWKQDTAQPASGNGLYFYAGGIYDSHATLVQNIASAKLDASQITSGTLAAARLPSSAVQINSTGGITNVNSMNVNTNLWDSGGTGTNVIGVGKYWWVKALNKDIRITGYTNTDDTYAKSFVLIITNASATNIVFSILNDSNTYTNTYVTNGYNFVLSGMTWGNMFTNYTFRHLP